MKIFGLNITRANKEKRSVENTYTPYSNVLPFGNAYYGGGAMSLSAVYRATELISDTIAMLPINVRVLNESHKQYSNNHSINLVFKSGTGLLSKYTFMKLLVQSVMLKGNGYAYIERGESGVVTGLRFLESGDVTINFDKANQILTYTANYIKGRITPDNMIHLVKNTWDGVNGVSVLSYAKRTTEISNSTENSAKSFFSNGCNLAGIINVQGQLTEKQKQDIRANWTQAWNGTESNGCLLGVMQGNMSYQPIQINATDSQMLESRQFNVQDIARFFGISPVLLGDLSHLSYNTIEALQQEFILHTLQPYISMIEEEFNRKIFKDERDKYSIDLDETAILKADKQAVANYYGTLIDKGILCINEVRKELGYSEIEGGDKHIIAYTDITQNTINSNETTKEDNNKDEQE